MELLRVKFEISLFFINKFIFTTKFFILLKLSTFRISNNIAKSRMKKIETKPLTSFSKLPIKIASKRHIDLRKSNLSGEEQEDLMKKFLQEIGKLKESGKIILAQSHEDDSFIMAKISPSKAKQNTLIFQEPNPVVIYYNSAIDHSENAIIIQNEIISKNWTPDELYPIFIDFFKESFQVITQLTMSLEALFNQKIPEDIQLSKGGNILDKKGVEWIEFKEKFRYTLPIITGIDIYKDYIDDYQNIIRLNALRNDLIHLKSLRQENFTFYQTLFKELIDFEFERHTTSVHNVITLLE